MSDIPIINFVAGGLSEEDRHLLLDVSQALTSGTARDSISDELIHAYLRMVNGSEHPQQRVLAHRLEAAARLRDLAKSPVATLDVNSINLDRYFEREGFKLKEDYNALKEIVDWAQRGHEKAFATIMELAQTWVLAFNHLKGIALNQRSVGKPRSSDFSINCKNQIYPESMVRRANEALNGNLNISHWIKICDDPNLFFVRELKEDAFDIMEFLRKRNHPHAVRYFEEKRQREIREREIRESEANNLDLLIEKSKDDTLYLEDVYLFYKRVCEDRNFGKKIEIISRLNELPLEYWIQHKTHYGYILTFLAKMYHRKAIPCLQELASHDSLAVSTLEHLATDSEADDPTIKNRAMQAARNVNLSHWLELAKQDPSVAHVLLRFKKLGHVVANDLDQINEIRLASIFPDECVEYAYQDPVFQSLRDYCELEHAEAFLILSRIVRGHFPQEGEPPRDRIDYGTEAVKVLLDIEKQSDINAHIRAESTRILDGIDFNLWINAAKNADDEGLKKVFTTLKMLANRPTSANRIVAALKTLICLNPDEVKNYVKNLELAIETLDEIATGNSTRPRFQEYQNNWFLDTRNSIHDYLFCDEIKKAAASAILDPALLGRQLPNIVTDNAIALLTLARHGNTGVIDYLLEQANKGQMRAVYLLKYINSPSFLDLPFPTSIQQQAGSALANADWTVWVGIALSPTNNTTTHAEHEKIEDAKKILTLLSEYQPELRAKLPIIYFQNGDDTFVKKVKKHFPPAGAMALFLSALSISNLLPTAFEQAQTQAHHTFASADFGSDVRSIPPTQRTKILRQSAALKRARTFDRLKFTR